MKPRRPRFVLRPSCEHFFEMTKMLHNNDKKWDKVTGWGHELPYWLSASDKRMRPGWDFFDARGNQGHMYNYFLFEAKDLTLIYEKKVLPGRCDPTPSNLGFRRRYLISSES